MRKVQKFAMPVHDWKIAHLQVVQRVILDVLQLSRRSPLRRIDAKKEYKLSSDCVEGLVRIPEATCSAPNEHPPHVYSYLPSKRSWLCPFMLESDRKDGKPYIYIPPSTCSLTFAVGFYVILLANSTLPCASSGDGT